MKDRKTRRSSDSPGDSDLSLLIKRGKNKSGRISLPPVTFINRYFPSPVMRLDALWRCGPWNDTMVSRRKILSRSRDGLNSGISEDEEEDVWFRKDRLFRDHVQEVLNKWHQIDDEIWGKIIVMERNRRVAKAYARVPVLTVNGSDDGFDGYRIGLCGFDNPMRDSKTEELKKHIGHGVKIKMDEEGNIMVKRVSKSNAYVKEVKTEENSISNDVIIAGGFLEMEKAVKIFDMKKFASNVNRELRRAYPDRRKLESQCISVLSFVKDAPELLDCACWVMIVNIVALDMLRSKLPPKEDPYAVPTPSESVTSRIVEATKEPKPPKLPPRDRVPVPLPDYDDWHRGRPSKTPQQSGYKDDPYCCGMKARVPNFGRRFNTQPSLNHVLPVRKSHSSGYLGFFKPGDRVSGDTAKENEVLNEDDYSKVYGRMRSTNGAGSGTLYYGEWE